MNFVLYGLLTVGVAYTLYQFSNLMFYLFAKAFGYIDGILQDRYMKRLHNVMMERMNRLDAIVKDVKKYKDDNLDDLAA